MHKRIIYSFFSLLLVSIFFYSILNNQYQDEFTSASTKIVATCRIIDSTYVNVSLESGYKIIKYPNTLDSKKEFDCWVQYNPPYIEWNLVNYYKLIDHIIILLMIKVIIIFSIIVIVLTFVFRESNCRK